MPMRSAFIAAALAVLSLAPADAATWTIGPDPCPVPAGYFPEADVVSPDARDGVRPGSRTAPDYWPPAALTVEVPGGALGRPLFLWFDGDVFRPAASGAEAPGCSAASAAPQ